MTTLQNLVDRAKEVRDEKQYGANKATRVGSLFYDIILFFNELFSTKQDKTDNSLATTDKSVVGAINEVKQAVDDVAYDVANYVPLTGTEEGKPVTGTVEFDTNNGRIRFAQGGGVQFNSGKQYLVGNGDLKLDVSQGGFDVTIPAANTTMNGFHVNTKNGSPITLTAEGTGNIDLQTLGTGQISLTTGDGGIAVYNGVEIATIDELDNVISNVDTRVDEMMNKFIPLTGTVEDKPVTGLINFLKDADAGIQSIDSFSEQRIGFKDDGLHITTVGHSTYLETTDSIYLQPGGMALYNDAEIATKEDIAAIPAPPPPTIYNISEMFNFPSDADFVAELHVNTQGGRDIIFIRAQDTTNITSDLVITAVQGFGMYNGVNDSPKLHAGTTAADDGAGGYTYEDYTIRVTAETNDAQTNINIPAECNTVDLFYFRGSVPPVASYYIDGNNVYHGFELENTPIANFCKTPFLINGQAVSSAQIKSIFFGDSYNSVTAIPNYFSAGAATSVDLHGLKNVTTIGNYVLKDNTALTEINLSNLTSLVSIGDEFLFRCRALSKIDLPNVTSLVSIGEEFLFYCSALTEINLSGFSNVTTIGISFMPGCTSLASITIGEADFSSTTVGLGAFQSIPNSSTKTIIANSQELADKFKAIFTFTSNWSVVVTE